MDRSSIIFCAGCIVATVAISWIAFPYAALDPGVVARAQTAQPAELMDDVDVGQGFGKLPVIELMGYYVENPPAVSTGGPAAPELQFGGC
jgi:hypothetical protein